MRTTIALFLTMAFLSCKKDDPAPPATPPPAPLPEFSGITPAQFSPEGASANPPTYVWSKVDDANRYALQIERWTFYQDEWIWASAHGATNLSNFTDTTWTPSSAYGGFLDDFRWRVRAQGNYGVWSEWSGWVVFQPQ